LAFEVVIQQPPPLALRAEPQQRLVPETIDQWRALPSGRTRTYPGEWLIEQVLLHEPARRFRGGDHRELHLALAGQADALARMSRHDLEPKGRAAVEQAAHDRDEQGLAEVIAHGDPQRGDG